MGWSKTIRPAWRQSSITNLIDNNIEVITRNIKIGGHKIGW
jgi:hypothetical protein